MSDFQNSFHRNIIDQFGFQIFNIMSEVGFEVSYFNHFNTFQFDVGRASRSSFAITLNLLLTVNFL